MRTIFLDELKLNAMEKLTISGLGAVVLDLAWVVRDLIVNGFSLFYILLIIGFASIIYQTGVILWKYHKKREHKLEEKHNELK